MMWRTVVVSGFSRTVLVVAASLPLLAPAVFSQARAPKYQVQSLWPRPFPDQSWVLGSITGVAVDGQNHIWVTHRGADSLENNEKGMMLTPPTSSACCLAAPLVVEFDADGKLVSSFSRPGENYKRLQAPGSIAVDAKGNVWIAAAGLEPAPAGGRGRVTGSNADPDAVPSARGRGEARGDAPPAAGRGRGGPPMPTGPDDAHVLKFSRDGQFLMQIGEPGKTEGPDSKTTLNRPAAVAVDSAANEVYVADSGNHRVVVFDANSGLYKRHWGAYGEAPN